MVRIIVVHGRGAKPSQACKLRYVREVLTESVRRVDPKAGSWLARHPGTVQLAYYADLFRRRSGEAPERCGGFREPIDRLYAESRHCPTWLRFRWLMQGLGVDATSLVVRFLKPATRQRLVARQFGDVLRYFRDHAFGSRVRERLQELLVPALRRRERILLLAHSLGSVVAYDVLWKLSHMSEYAPLRRRSHLIERLVTMGSPLGDRWVKAQLLGWRYPLSQRFPVNIRHWTNLSARGDAICHDKSLANDFQPMLAGGLVEAFTEHVNLCTVYRGRGGVWNPHKLYGYLILPEVGRLVAQHLRSPPSL